MLDLAEQIATEHFAPHNRTADQQRAADVDGERVAADPRGRRGRCEVFAEAGLIGRRAATRQSAACSCRTSSAQAVLRRGSRRPTSAPSAYPFLTMAQRQPAARPRHAGADRHLRAARCSRAAGSARWPVRAAGRLVAGRHHHPGRAPGRRHLPADRQQDVDLRRRPRADREHRAPGAGQDPRRTARGEGHLAVPRAASSWSSADGSLGERNDVVLAGLNHKMGYRGTTNTAAQLRRGRAHPGRAGRRGRLPGRRAAPRADLHVPHDERGADRRRHGRDRARLHRLPARARLRPHPHAGPAGRRPRTRPRRRCRSSSTPTCGGCCWPQKSYVEGGLALGLYCARLVDEEQTAPSPRPTAPAAHLLLDVLTPIAKSWPSQWCLVANDLAIQVHGGYGYTRDYPVEQFYRDNRLNPIHEGTHGIQALDLLGRKVVMQGGAGPGAARRDDRARRRRGRPAPSGPASPPTSTPRSPGCGAVDRDAVGRRRPGGDAGQRARLPGGRRAPRGRLAVAGAGAGRARPDRRLLRGQAAGGALLLPLRAAAHRPQFDLLESLDRTTLDMRPDWF